MGIVGADEFEVVDEFKGADCCWTSLLVMRRRTFTLAVELAVADGETCQ